jgi:hypothetical protein
MNESQRGMVGAKLAQLTVGSNQHSAIALPSQKQAAELSGSTTASIKRAKPIVQSGIQDHHHLGILDGQDGIDGIDGQTEPRNLPKGEIHRPMGHHEGGNNRKRGNQ